MPVSRSSSSSYSATSGASRSERFLKIISSSVCIHTQVLVFGVEREHHLGRSCRIGRESVGANRHDQTIHTRGGLQRNSHFSADNGQLLRRLG